MGLIIIPLLYLLLAGWVSYYTASSVYKSLKADSNKNAGLFKWLVFIVVFAAITALGIYLVAANFKLER